MKNENLKTQLAKSIISKNKEIADLCKALVALSPYKVGDRIKIEDAFGNKSAGIVQDVDVITDGWQCRLIHCEDGAIVYSPTFAYKVQLFKANGQLGLKTTFHFIEVIED